MFENIISYIVSNLPAFFVCVLILCFLIWLGNSEDDEAPRSPYDGDRYAVAKGRRGERIVEKKLAKLGARYNVINDVLLQNGNRTTQIDHIVISPYGIFVIETKNYTGKLVGTEDDNYVAHLCKCWKFMIYNPLKQNQGHVKAVAKALGIFDTTKIVPILTVSDRCTCSIKTHNIVVPFSDIRRTIHRYRHEVLTPAEVAEYTAKIRSINITAVEERKKHVERTRLLNELPF